MSNIYRVFLSLVIFCCAMQDVNGQNELWFSAPAERWFEALPIGNGMQGAMVYGGIKEEQLALTENTYYSGEVSQNIQKGASGYMPKIRKALLSNDHQTVETLSKNILGEKSNYGTNLPMANLKIGFEHGENVKGYKRSLSLDNAAVRINYNVGDVIYTREYLASNPDGVIAIRFTANKKEALNFTLELDGYERPLEVSGDGSNLFFTCKAWEKKHSDGRTGVDGFGAMSVTENDGTTLYENGKLHISEASNVTVVLTMDTSFMGNDSKKYVSEKIALAKKKSFQQLKKSHEEDYRKLFHRMSFALGSDLQTEIPTEERVKKVAAGGTDTGLIPLMYQYARYLTIASSRENSVLPSHLQGIWNDNIACQIGWTCDMHLDVNTQMNYWLTETTNLQECATPLFSWIENILVPSGEKTAKGVYGAKGWVAHTVSNPWGFTAPGWDTGWGLHPTGGAWVASHLWDHYTFTGDVTFLKDRAYPVLKGSAEFFMDYMFLDSETGHWMTGPSYSPENKFLIDGERFALGRMPTSDLVVIRKILKTCIKSAKILGIDKEFAGRLEKYLEEMPPYQIGSKGQLQEWYFDYEEALPNHRHMTHLLGVFPYASITPEVTPEFADAAWKSVLLRKTPKENWEDTGWARSMLLLNSARLWKPEAAYENLTDMLRLLTEDNLMVIHPPTAGAQSNVYELDGNTGMCAGVTEMLFQSHLTAKDINVQKLKSAADTPILHLLPALPSEWAEGEIKGLLARGGFEVNIRWKENKNIEAKVTSKTGRPVVLRYQNQFIELDLKRGESYTWKP